MEYNEQLFDGFTVKAVSTRTAKGFFATASLQAVGAAPDGERQRPITMGPFLTEYVAMAVVIDRMRCAVEQVVGSKPREDRTRRSLVG